jgi:hypothetical protein
MKGIVDSLLCKYYSYIRVYGTTRTPHLLPCFLLDCLLMRDISYQTMGSGITSLLLISNKNIWPVFPIHIGNYTISNNPHAIKEAETLQELHLFLGDPKGHEPNDLAVSQVRFVGFTHSNIHVVDFEEDRFRGVLWYEQSLHKLPNNVAR